MPKPDSQPFDPRLTPARADLAAAHLRAKVTAARYATPKLMQVCAPLTPLYAVADAASPLQTELLLGERFDVYEQNNGWVWGQSRRDGFVGYCRADDFCALTDAPDRRICALRTPIFADPDLKAPVRGFAHGNSVLYAETKEDRYIKIAGGLGWVFARHTIPLGEVAQDWVAIAQSYAHTPYVWGGRSSCGLDCSALVQNALEAGGIAALRDSDMQQGSLGKAVPVTTDLSGLRRGDLVFWKGHVGIMLDAQMFLHANAHHMCVAHEPLAEAVSRIQKTAGAITAIRRL